MTCVIMDEALIFQHFFGMTFVIEQRIGTGYTLSKIQIAAGGKNGQICEKFHHSQHRLFGHRFGLGSLHVMEPFSDFIEIRAFPSQLARMGIDDDLRGRIPRAAEILGKTP